MAKTIRRNEKTPNCGDYSEIWYLDCEHNVVDESEATEFVIRECKKNSELIQSTYGLMNDGH